MQLCSDNLAEPAAAYYARLEKAVVPRLAELTACRSARELVAHPVYAAIEPLVRAVLDQPHIADYRRTVAPPRATYRFVAWNLERGTHLEAQLDLLKHHAELASADVLLITEADAGMVRSGNRMVAETIAKALGMTQVFAPCYLALGKGSGAERDAEGVNRFGLHGNALLSRYPIRDVRAIPLENGVDKMRHREQRIGRQAAVAARIEFPNASVEAASMHLDAQSTQRHRRDQMRVVLAALDPKCPAVIGGDWNTSTYDSSHAAWAIFGFWLRVMMGVDHVIRNHYLHPDRLFERGLFRDLVAHGFDYRACNASGEGTTCYDINDLRATRNLGDWVPAWCFAFIRWSLRNHGGKCPLKLDWFATRGVRAERPFIIHDLRDGRGTRLSDHDPIGVDVTV
jgi:endonuclease/exonuclease/phosphatase family metal-dependent hydrolase